LANWGQKRQFGAWLKRSPDTATPDEVRRFQLDLIESGTSICNRNRIMTGVRYDLAAEVWHIKEPQKLPPVLSPRGGQARLWRQA
jgi:hypothetical protein